MPAPKKTTRRRMAPRANAVAAVAVPDTCALIAVLQAHALGEHEMTATQVNVALSLLKIYGLPDIAAAHAATRSHEDALAELG